MTGPVAFILKGYPRLSETFITQEILGMEDRGMEVRLYSLRHPTDASTHPMHARVRAPIVYLPEYLKDAPGRVLRAWRAQRRRPEYRAARRVWLRDLRRDPTPNRVRRFGQALVLAHELPAEITHLHAHFLHTPASVTRYAALLSGRGWSFSAHAKDIWTTPDWEKAEKLADCAWAVTCTAFGARHLSGLSQDSGKVELLYHGLDRSRFPPMTEARQGRDGSAEADPVRLLSVGRAVEKKGYDILLAALARLPATLHWRLVHIGGGPLLKELRRGLAPQLAGRIEWRGAQPADAVLAAYREADLFVLASRIAADGDRDGLPNVLMEAQSQALACLSTGLAGTAELIEDGVTGLLVAPDDADALAAALARLIGDAALRARLGQAGFERLVAHFDSAAGLDRLAAKFRARS